MKKKLFSGILALLVILSLFSPQTFAEDEQILQPGDVTAISAREEAILDLIDYKNVARMAKELTEGIGNRYTASFRRDMTVDYIMNEFKNAGYDPYVHEFTIQNTSGTINYYKNGSVEIAGEKYMYYGPTYAADTVYKLTKAAISITGTTVVNWSGWVNGTGQTPSDIGSSFASAIEGADYSGKAVFVPMSGTSAPNAANYYSAALAIQKAGAAAVIFEYFQPRDDGNTSYSRIGNTVVGSGNSPVTIPVGAVLYNETHSVISALSENTAVNITMDTSSRGRNVVAVLPSATGSKKTVYVTSHLDSQISTPGMNDNASGVIMTLEMARAFRNIPFEYNIAFIAFDAEETGLTGARRFCFDMTDEDRANFVANYNMDMIATNQDDCIHMFLNISDTGLRTLEGTLPTNDDRLMNLPAAVQIAKGYEVFNYSYLAALKTNFPMEYFNICYDTTTDHYAFVVEATRNGNNFRNMMNAVEYDWRRNGKGTSFETLYHKTGDTFDVNYSESRMKAISDIVALAVLYSAKADVSKAAGSFAVDVDKKNELVTVSGSGYTPNSRLEILGAYNTVAVQSNSEYLDQIYTDAYGRFAVSFKSSVENWLGGHDYSIAVNGVAKSVPILTTTAELNHGVRLNAVLRRPIQLNYNLDGVKYEFYSSNPAVATVSTTGLLTPVRVGTAVITLRTTDGSNLISAIVVNVRT